MLRESATKICLYLLTVTYSGLMLIEIVGFCCTGLVAAVVLPKRPERA
jgi:hypothetical protein